MTTPPLRPKLYHITHVDNLRVIATDGRLVSDALMIAQGGPVQAIGMSGIKRRRVVELDVDVHPDTKVGDYVPFYFCPRSVMLYVIHCANHPQLTYRGGQEPIVHLEADLHAVIERAERTDTRWAFSLSNAGARYAEFRSRIEELNQLDWTSIAATDFRPAEVKERKQAEFLAFGRVPFDLIERIGVYSSTVQTQAVTAIADTGYRTPIEIRRQWYF